VSGAESYNVYTCSTADGTYESLANVGSSSFFHTPNTTTLYYKVSYIDESSAESPLSPASGFVNYSYTYSAGNTNNVFIAYGFDMGYTTASEFVEYEIGTANCSVISKWNSSYQAWQSATYLDGFGWDGDFDLVRGGTYMLGFNSNANVYIYGAVESNPTYNFVLTDYTDINSLMVPLDNIICSNASDLGNVINDGSNRVTTLSQWISDGQGWHTATYISEIDYWVGDFEISVGQPLMIGVEANFEWPEE
jgi:hypothetical protein